MAVSRQQKRDPAVDTLLLNTTINCLSACLGHDLVERFQGIPGTLPNATAKQIRTSASAGYTQKAPWDCEGSLLHQDFSLLSQDPWILAQQMTSFKASLLIPG